MSMKFPEAPVSIRTVILVSLLDDRMVAVNNKYARFTLLAVRTAALTTWWVRVRGSRGWGTSAA